MNLVSTEQGGKFISLELPQCRVLLGKWKEGPSDYSVRSLYAHICPTKFYGSTF